MLIVTLWGPMDASPDPESAPGSDLVYAYKPSLLGAPLEFCLTEAGLQWSRGRHINRIPYDRIRRLRLSFRPVSMQSHRFVTEIWAPGAPKLQICSVSWRSVVEQERLDAAYARFVTELHRRLPRAGSVSLEAGFPPVLYWIGVAVFVAASLGLAALTARALQVGALAAATIVGGFLALFLWQVGTIFRRNKPLRYRADALPPEVLPRFKSE